MAETDRLKQLWKKLVRMFHPDLHEQDQEKRKTYELLTQAIHGVKAEAEQAAEEARELAEEVRF